MERISTSNDTSTIPSPAPPRERIVERSSQGIDEGGKVDPGVYDYSRLMRLDIQPPTAVVEGLLIEGQVGVLAGRFSIGKTLFSLQLTISMTTGRDFLGRRVARPYKVALIDTENGVCEIKSRIQKQVAAFNLSENEQRLFDRNWIYVDCNEEGDLQYLKLDDEGFKKLSSFVGQHEVEVLIVDNYGQVFPWDEKDEERTKQFFNSLRSLRNNRDSLQSGVILFLHHVTKATETNQFSLLTSPYEYLSRARGSGRLLDFSPIRLALAEEPSMEGEPFYVVNGFIRSGEVSPLVLERNPETLCFELNADKGLVSKRVFTNAPRKLELYGLLPDQFTFEQAAGFKNKEGKDFSRKTVADTLRVGCANNLLRKNTDGSYSRPS